MNSNSTFKKGDNIAGESFSMGKYIGLVNLYEKEFHQVYDSSKKMTLFLSAGSTNALRKLPSEEQVKEKLKIFNIQHLIDEQELEGSRYKYFKEKLTTNCFGHSIEVLHDLNLLIHQGKASLPERKLFYGLKERLLCEISFILNRPSQEIEKMYLSPQ